jgi:hypothetical protein
MESIVIDGEIYSFFDQKTLLYGTITTPIQSAVAKCKNICTGFSYMAYEASDKLIEYYNTDSDKYRELVVKLMEQACKRKCNNTMIHSEGEYIDEDTLKVSFPNLYDSFQFVEIIIKKVDNENNIVKNKEKIENALKSLKVNEPIIFLRSYETFIMIKLNNDEFLVVDSHQPYHGKVSVKNAIEYIILAGLFSGSLYYGMMNHS